MNDSILIKHGSLGNRTEMPKLVYDEAKGSEFGYREDTKELYIASKDGNVRLCGADDIKALMDRLTALEGRLTALETPSE